jgi:hypothetical protein
MEIIEDIELSIKFGQKLMKYEKTCLEQMLKSMEKTDKIRQHYQADKLYICDVINGLERGENIPDLFPIKNRLTVIGQQFFKNEFKELKMLSVRRDGSNINK